jgi:hypothetical protein
MDIPRHHVDVLYIADSFEIVPQRGEPGLALTWLRHRHPPVPRGAHATITTNYTQRSAVKMAIGINPSGIAPATATTCTQRSVSVLEDRQLIMGLPGTMIGGLQHMQNSTMSAKTIIYIGSIHRNI